MLEYIYINYVLIGGTALVIFSFFFALTVWFFNFLFDFIQAVWSDIKYFFTLVWKLITGVIVPLLRVWWIITRAPIFILLIILNSLKYIFGGTLKVLSKYWRSYGYVAQEDTIWHWEQRTKYYTNKSMRIRFSNVFKKYLSIVYPHKYTRNRYNYTLAFVWGYWLRWCSYLFYLMFYYLIFLFRRILHYIWIKPFIIDMFFFIFYYIYRTLGWWINVWFYKLCWNMYVFIRRQLFYFIPNWFIADIVKDLNLNWFQGNFEANFNPDDDDTPEDLFMNNPNKKVVNFFFNIFPVTAWQQISHINYPCFVAGQFSSLILRYFVILPLYIMIMGTMNIIMLLIDILCINLFSTHKIWWNLYKFFLRQQYHLYMFVLNIGNWYGYKLCYIPLKNLFVVCVRFLWSMFNSFIPMIIREFFGKILALLFYMVYAIMWCVYYSPALLITMCVWICRFMFKYRVIWLFMFLSYYWVYDQISEMGGLLLGSIQSTLEYILRNTWFHMPIDMFTRFSASNKYQFMKFWGGLHDLNTSIWIHYYSDVFKPDLAYMGYYQLNGGLNSANNIQGENWPLYYNRQRNWKFYHRSFIEREQMQWNYWFFKFIEGTYIWDPAPNIAYEWNEGKNFNWIDLKRFVNYKRIFRASGTPVVDLFWFFQEDETEKWERIMESIPRYYLFEPHVLQEEEELLPQGWLNLESWKNWLYYDLLNTAYLVPFDLPIEGSRQGAIGYQPGYRPPHLFTMLSTIDPIEYSIDTQRQKTYFPMLNSMNYTKILYQMRDNLITRKSELVRQNLELIRDKWIWDEIYADTTEWQMRLFTATAYPFKWLMVYLELIRIGIFKIFVYTRTTYWLYYYYYQPEIRIYFYMSFIQKLILIYPWKWLCFCWQLGNSVYPLPEKTVNFIYQIFYLIYSYCVWFITGIVNIANIYIVNNKFVMNEVYLIYNNLFSIWSQLLCKWLYIINGFIYIKNLLFNIIQISTNYLFDDQQLPTDIWSLLIDNSMDHQTNNYYNILYLTWWYMLYFELYSHLYIYFSIDEYYIYLLYKYNCYMWYLHHIIQGYIYLLQNSFYIDQGKSSWFSFTEYMIRHRGLIDRRVIYDIVPDIKNILAYGYVREYGPWSIKQQIKCSWLKNVIHFFNVKDWGICMINYIFFLVWYTWDIFCQFLYNWLLYGQNHCVSEWKYTIKGWFPMLMAWINKTQLWLDNIYIYLQFPRRLNKYGLTYTCRGYDLLDELNMLYTVRRTNFGNTRTWKSLNMLTYLVLMVKYPNTWEHFTMLHNSPIFMNSNGLRVVASKIFANVSGWTSAIYYFTLLLLIFVSSSFRNLLFCTIGNPPVYSNNREFRWQSGRAKAGKKLNWLFIADHLYEYINPYVELDNYLPLHMDYYSKLMYMNNQLPIEYKQIRAWIDKMHKNTIMHRDLPDKHNLRKWYLSSMSIAYLLNPYYYSLHTNFAYSSNNFNKFMAYATRRDIDMNLSGENLEINRAYTEVHPTYLYHQSYVDLHIKQLDKLYQINFDMDKYLFDFKLPDWAWHRDGFNMRILSSKNPVDLTQQLTYVYEEERGNYIPWAIFGWLLAVPVCLVIKPLASLGQWLSHSNKEDPAWAWHLSYYFNNFWYHISFVKYLYYITGPWIPETKLLASMETEESEDYWHYHEQSGFLREFFYAYEDEEPVDGYQLLYTRTDPWWESSLEEVRLFIWLNLIVLLCTLIIAMFKKNPSTKTNLSQVYYMQYIPQWDTLKYLLPLKTYIQKFFPWFWR